MEYPQDVIEVTQEDIEAGCDHITDPGTCPIARAMIRAGYKVEVWYDNVDILDDRGDRRVECIPFPKEISDWQKGPEIKKREPFEFSLNELRKAAKMPVKVSYP